jgi:hypothetical protein
MELGHPHARPAQLISRGLVGEGLNGVGRSEAVQDAIDSTVYADVHENDAEQNPTAILLASEVHLRRWRDCMR